jgi:hypothetical protein
MIAPFAVSVGIVLLGVALWDAFSSVVLPRTVSGALRPARHFTRLSWRLWRFMGSWVSNRRARQSFLTAFGPFSVFLLLSMWAVMILLAFALLHFGLGTQLPASMSQGRMGWLLYMSGTTFFTLGLGDVVPLNPLGRALIVAEVGTGIVFLAMIIGYLPVLDQAYAQREVDIQLLESRAGSPQSAARLLRRFGRPASAEALAAVLREAERWAAELSQSHIAHPVLVYYRAQHLHQSWLLSLTMLLDACALLIISRKGEPSRQARATFRMAVRVAVDLARVLGVTPERGTSERLPPADLPRLSAVLKASGLILPEEPETEAELRELREHYEPYVLALAVWLLVPLPEWLPAVDEKEDGADLLTFDDFG